MATTYDQQQQGSANKDLAQKNEAKVPAGQGTEVVNVAHGNIANTFAKAESEKTNKQGQSNDPYSTFNYYRSNGTLGSCFYGKVNGKSIKEYSFKELQKLSEPNTFTISYTDGDAPTTVKSGRLFALGRYQIIPKTRNGLLSKKVLQDNKVTENSIFSEQVQDLCYSSFIKDVRKSVGQYLENKTVTDQLLDAAALELAKEWASIGIKPGVKNSKKRIGAKNGLTSYYSGDGLNNAHISYFKIVEALKADREAVQSGRMAIQTTANGLAAQGASKAAGAADNTAKADTASDKADASATVAENSTTPASTTAPTTAINIDVQSAITFNKRVNAGRVKAIQTLVGTKADGAIGPNTVNKIAEWQQEHNLTPDGKFGSGSLDYAIKNCGFKDPLASGGNTNTGTTNANSGSSTAGSTTGTGKVTIPSGTTIMSTGYTPDLELLKNHATQNGYSVREIPQAARYVAKYCTGSSSQRQCTRGTALFLQLASYARGEAKRTYASACAAHLFGSTNALTQYNISSSVAGEFSISEGSKTIGKSKMNSQISKELTKDGEFVTFKYASSQHIVFRASSGWYSDFKQGTATGCGDEKTTYSTVHYFKL